MSAVHASNMGVASRAEKHPAAKVELGAPTNTDLGSQILWLHSNWRRGMRAVDIFRRLKPGTRQAFKGLSEFVGHMKAICDNESLDWVDVIVAGQVFTIIFSVKE